MPISDRTEQADDDSIVDAWQQGRCEFCEQNLFGELIELLSTHNADDGNTPGKESGGHGHGS